MHKSPGPDGLPDWLLKKFAALISDTVAAIFNASVRKGCVPRIWKSVEVMIPAPKVNPPTSIQNHLRRISLLSTFAKVLEKIVGSWLLLFLEPHLDNNQFCCRRSRSTAYAINWHFCTLGCPV